MSKIKTYKNKIKAKKAKIEIVIGNPIFCELKRPTSGNVKTATVIEPQLAPKYLNEANDVRSFISFVNAGISEPIGIAITVYKVVNVMYEKSAQ